MVKCEGRLEELVTQNAEVVRDGDIEAISVGEDAAPGPRVQGADLGQEEEASD